MTIAHCHRPPSGGEWGRQGIGRPRAPPAERPQRGAVYLGPVWEHSRGVRHFLAKYNQAFGRQVLGMTRDALAVLEQYSWPGNVRELENLIARLVASSRARVLEV